jgi:hypothetical protein
MSHSSTGRGFSRLPIRLTAISKSMSWNKNQITSAEGRGGMQWRSWLRHYATSRKVAGSSPEEVGFFSIYLIPPAALWPWGRLSL